MLTIGAWRTDSDLGGMSVQSDRHGTVLEIYGHWCIANHILVGVQVVHHEEIADAVSGMIDGDVTQFSVTLGATF